MDHLLNGSILTGLVLATVFVGWLMTLFWSWFADFLAAGSKKYITPSVLDWKLIFSKGNQSNDAIFFSHMVLSFLFFSNYFIWHRPLIASTDAININFPLLIEAKKNFLNGYLGLWNPNILSGVPAFASSNIPLFSPENWILFLFPMNYFFLALTFFSFLKVWLVGVFSYLLFFEEFQNKKWAFFASLVYQLSGYTNWSTMIYDVLSMYLFTTIALYLIWTIHKRKQYLNLILLTLVLLVNMLSSNISYTSYSMLLIAICFLYRFCSQYSKNYFPRHFISCALAIVFSVAMHLFRLIPTFIESFDSNRGFGFSADFRDASFLLLRLFDPELFGVCYRNSFAIIERLGNAFQGMHIQWAMPQFFGVLPALLVIWAIISPQKGRINFWTVYTIIALALIVFIEPFDTFFRLINPVYHTLSMQIFLPVGFSMLAGFAGKNLEEKGENFQLSGKLWMMFIFILLIVFLYMLVVGSLASYISEALFAFFSTIVLLFLWFFALKRQPEFRLKVFKVILAIICLGLVISLVKTYDNPTNASHHKNLSVSLICLIFISFLPWVCVKGRLFDTKWFSGLSVLLLIIFLYVILYPWSNSVRHLPDHGEVAYLGMLGFVRFAVISIIFLSILYLFHKRSFKASWLFPFFISIFLIEQLPTLKIHNHIVINPFYKYSNPFPRLQASLNKDGSTLNLDLQNYRVNFPNKFLNIPLYNELYGKQEVLSSISSIYNIRSYGGHYNVVNTRYDRFLKGVVPNLAAGEVGYGLYARIGDERFLDLAGVKYHWDIPNERLLVRPNALSRAMLFKNFKVLHDDDITFEYMRGKNFNPLKTIILDKDPGISQNSASDRAQPLTILNDNPDVIELNVDTDVSGIVLLNDSYHEGWSVYIDKKKQEVLTGNYNFVAAVVPTGKHSVVFRFEPVYFALGLQLAWLGLGLLIVSVFILFLYRDKLDNRLSIKTFNI